MMKRVQKGFTLLELVIVMALFSIIMYSVMQFLDPVTKFFVRSSNFETTTACIDNMKRAIEGNLKYADRVRAYSHYNESTIDANVTTFWEDFFKDRELMDCKGEIYVLVFHNSHYNAAGNAVEMDEWFLDDLNDYNKSKLNSGKITLYRYGFDKDKVLPNAAPIDWYVNQKMYAHYNYTFELGKTASSSFFSGGGSTFDPSDCTITIHSKEVLRAKDGTNRCYESSQDNTTVASFSMKNVLDSSVSYASPAIDYKVVRAHKKDPVTHLPTAELETEYKLNDARDDWEQTKYEIETMVDPSDASKMIPVEHSRYEALKDSGDPSQFNGFYFIFTLPDTVYDAGQVLWNYDPSASDNMGSYETLANTKTEKMRDPAYDDAYFTQVEDAFKSTP